MLDVTLVLSLYPITSYVCIHHYRCTEHRSYVIQTEQRHTYTHTLTKRERKREQSHTEHSDMLERKRKRERYER